MSDAIEIRYKTIVTMPRPGVSGDVLRRMSERPFVWGGAIGGLAVGAALLNSPGVLESAPWEAAFLGLMVWIAWTVLMGFMGPFFRNLALMDLEVVRLLEYDGESLVWHDGETERRWDAPSFRLMTKPVPSNLLADEKTAAQPWDVWVVVSADDEQFVLHSKLAAAEASEYPTVEEAIEQAEDEYLPPHIASPLLLMARS